MCRKALYEFALLEGVEHLALALSGGKDSLTLLYLLKAISGRGLPPFKLTALHVEGDFSCGAGISVGYLRRICEELGVGFQSQPYHKQPTDCYSCSRDRRSILFEMAKCSGISTLALGHHRDDSIQTLLMNLLHKAEFAAMLPKVPMHHYGVTLIRPLIFIEERDIQEFAIQHSFSRTTCQCPLGQTSLRKTTRLLIEELEKTFPNTRENLSRASFSYGSQKALL